MTFGGVEYKNFCEPLIDLATWDAAQRVNLARAEAHGSDHPRTVRSRFFLTGLLYCARCGLPMVGRVSHQRKPYTGKYDYYRCQSDGHPPRCGAKMIPKEDLESQVIRVVREQVLNPNVLADIYGEVMAQAEAKHANWEGDLLQKRNSLANLRQQTTRLVAAIRDAGHSPAMLASLADLEAQERALADILARDEVMPPAILQVDTMELAKEASDALELSSEVEKGIILRGFVKRIRAERNGKLTGELDCYAPGSDAIITVNL